MMLSMGGAFTPGELFAETQRVAENYRSPGVLDNLAATGNSVIQPTLDRGPGNVGPIGKYGPVVGTTALAAALAMLQKMAVFGFI